MGIFFYPRTLSWADTERPFRPLDVLRILSKPERLTCDNPDWSLRKSGSRYPATTPRPEGPISFLPFFYGIEKGLTTCNPIQ
ncbi:hypothetical protein EF405_16325 [Cyclobacteriaceae bacterium YHN15]|nr:hypothetical protein EF405_16325 [Cyclobacteriaceae bacterium YHN15]